MEGLSSPAKRMMDGLGLELGLGVRGSEAEGFGGQDSNGERRETSEFGRLIEKERCDFGAQAERETSEFGA